MINIKPCPFCGERYRVYVREAMLIPYFVQCESCLSRSHHYGTEEQAIALWNTRTSDADISRSHAQT